MTDQPEVPAGVQPGPVPTNFNVGTVPTDQGGAAIVLEVTTPAGVGIFFMDPATPVQLGNGLRAAGKAGVSRLVTPNGLGGLIVPGP